MRAKRLIFAILGLVALAALIWIALRPLPVEVEIAEVRRGALRVTVDEEGRTRVRERFVVAAPVAGQLQRVDLEPGDRVEVDAPVFSLLPAPSTPLDPRTAAELRQRLQAAEASLRSAIAAADFARSDLERQRRLAARGALARRDLEAAETRAEAADRQVQEARALANALRAQLGAASRPDGAAIVQRAPASGVVLRVHQESEAVVPAGTPVLEIGDPGALEVVTDLLSEEAVEVRAGAEVLLDRWGGATPLHGRVRLVEPAGFTRVSALGVEEQRVNVVIDFVDPPGIPARLGDGFRVMSRVVVYAADDVLQVPVGALFRTGEGWSVFVVEEDRARQRALRIGRRSEEFAQVLEGIEAGERVILYPGDRIVEGSLVQAVPAR